MNAPQILGYGAALLFALGAAWVALKAVKARKEGEPILKHIGGIAVLGIAAALSANAATALSGEDEAIVMEAGGANDLTENDDDFFADDFDDFGEEQPEGIGTTTATLVEAE